MVHNTQSRQRGDTLVEVLMAVVIISVVIVGAITMMNRGLASAQVALEHSQVRLGVNTQIEMLRFARDQFIRNPSGASAVQWRNMIAASDQQPIVYDASCAVSGSKTGFYFTKNASQVTRSVYTPTTPATIATAGAGLWVESVLSPATITPAYADFVIRACWQGTGSAGAQRTVTAVRLYDPSR